MSDLKIISTSHKPLSQTAQRTNNLWFTFCSASQTVRAMTVTASSKYGPFAVSPESIQASDPSMTALATSLHSARVGRGFEIIDSNICVAVITGFPAMLH
jgi:hypothetical protein